MREWSEVTRPSADCQTTIFRRSKQLEIFLKKSLNGHATVVGGHATVGRLSNNVFWTFQAIWEIFWKKSLNGHATVVGGHATVGRLSNNIFRTFQAIWENFEKSRWTVTRQGLRSRDRRPTVKQRFWTFQAIRNFLKKVAERSRDSGRRSRDRRPTVKQRFLDVSSDLGKFWKKSLNGHATVVEVTRPSADCQTTFFWTFQAIWENFEKSRWTVRDSGWGHATVGRLSNNVF